MQNVRQYLDSKWSVTVGFLRQAADRVIPYPERFFLFVGGFVVAVLIIVVPPFQAPDEHTHFYKEVHLSRGGLKAEILPYRVGARLPAEYYLTLDRYSYLFLHPDLKLHLSILEEDIKHPIDNPKPTPTTFENTAVYPPVPYIPQAIGIFITHLFTGSVLLQMYAARLMTAVAWLGLVYMAIRSLPFGKWAAVALALTPQMLFLAASAGADAVFCGLSLLFVGLAVRAIVGQKVMQYKEMLVLGLVLVGLGLSKAPYFLLGGLLLAIPERRFATRKQRVIFLLLAYGLTMLAVIGWQLYVKDTFVNIYPGSDNAAQLSNILHHPIGVFSVILKTLLIYPIGDNLILELVGLNGWVGAHTPLWLVLLTFTTIIFLALKDPLKPKIFKDYGSLPRILSGLIAAAGILTIALLLYMTFTPVRMTEVLGLQGRYFIPLSYLAIPALANTKLLPPHGKRSPYPLVVLLALLLIAFSVLPLTIIRYYNL